jgi:hypothetical protein
MSFLFCTSLTIFSWGYSFHKRRRKYICFQGNSHALLFPILLVDISIMLWLIRLTNVFTCLSLHSPKPFWQLCQPFGLRTYWWENLLSSREILLLTMNRDCSSSVIMCDCQKRKKILLLPSSTTIHMSNHGVNWRNMKYVVLLRCSNWS